MPAPLQSGQSRWTKLLLARRRFQFFNLLQVRSTVPAHPLHKVSNGHLPLRLRCCFVCDAHSGSNIDLVMAVQGVGMREALWWICERFDVPSVPQGHRQSSPERWSPRFRVGVSGAPILELIVRSGLWEDLSPSEKAILPVLLIYADPSTGLTTISYRGIMRRAGIGSPSTVSKVMRRFENIHMVTTVRGRDWGLRSVNGYCLSVDDSRFQELVTEIWRKQQEEIEIERQLRAEARKARSATCIGNTLSNQCSAERDAATG